MTEFTIGDTDFGIDPLDSSFVVESVDGVATANVEVRGNQERYEAISEDENSKWAWTLYPPHFYLRGVPVTVEATTGIGKIQMSAANLEGHEAAIYFMEHNKIDDMSVAIDPDKAIEVSGRVFLSGEPHCFKIKWACGQ